MTTLRASANATTYEGSLKYRLQWTSQKEVPDSSSWVQAYVQPNVSARLNDFISLHGQISLSLLSGRIQERFEDVSNSFFNIEDLRVSLGLEESIQFHVGALSQDHLGAWLFLNSQAFPGAKLSWRHKLKRSEFLLSAQHVIPTSTSLEIDRTQEETTPSFQTFGGQAKWETKRFKGHHRAHFFKYDNLPSVVAFKSSLYGNQILGTNQAQAQFAYGFKGWTQSHELEAQYSTLLLQNFKVQITENLEAPSDRARSQWLETSFTLKTPTMHISPFISYFYNESDAGPSFYSLAKWGRNNRKGLHYGLTLDFPKWNFRVKAEHIIAKKLEDTSTQNTLKFWNAYVEVFHVLF